MCLYFTLDCQMTDWVNSSCAQTCGNSTLESTRRISQINLNGGKDCPNEILVIYDCLDQIPCPIGETIGFLTTLVSHNYDGLSFQIAKTSIQNGLAVTAKLLMMVLGTENEHC